MKSSFLNSSHNSVVRKILELPRWFKTIIIMTSDYLMLVLSFWLSLSLRNNQIYIPTLETQFLILIGPFLALPVFYFFGLYQSIIRYSNERSLFIIVIASSIYTILWFCIVLISGAVSQPYDFLFINWLITIFFVNGTRTLAKWILRQSSGKNVHALIYGAGSAGIQLLSAMKHSPEINIKGFLDDDHSMHGRYIETKKVFDPKKIDQLIRKEKITEVLIAIPSAKRNTTRKIFNSLKKYPLIIRTLPSLNDMAQGRISISDLKKIKIEDLLKRPVREPNQKLLSMNIKSKNVLVTGAGGSIGSELCRQIVRLEPKLLVAFELSEYALYMIERELLSMNLGTKIIPVLCDAKDQARLEKVLNTYEIDTVYHAAAYKHVPMVERNTISGIETNIFGTFSCIKASVNSGVKNFVFISTDKAVRPTNIMGASKRFAELILQSFPHNHSDELKQKITKISIVRFGNVLGSSGSVIPLFRKQIEEGGPVTVTDPKIIRYFMTIHEAAQLVIQAGAMASDNDIFVLDMGEPVGVFELAKDMIRLSGMSLKDSENPNGEVEIIFTGLRPGEKLYEELLIDDDVQPTEHKKIMIAKDNGISWDILSDHILNLEKSLEYDDQHKIREIFLATVTGFKPEKEISDNLYLSKDSK